MSFQVSGVEKWFTDEIRQALAEIQPPHVSKKRVTLIRLAEARLNGRPLREVFRLSHTCSEGIWYAKWSRQPDVKAAYDLLIARADELESERGLSEIERLISLVNPGRRKS